MLSEYQIRRAIPDDATGIARVHIDSWHDTYRGIVPDEFLDSMDYAQRAERWRQRLDIEAGTLSSTLNLVAVDTTGSVVGFISGGRERERAVRTEGEIYAIYLLPDVKGIGLGRELIRDLVRALEVEGFTSLLVWVLSDNPSRHFYERLGGIEERRKVIDIGNQKFEEIAYVWSDLALLLTS